MFTGATMQEIERQVKGYISLKTALSFLTGGIVAVILLILQVGTPYTLLTRSLAPCPGVLAPCSVPRTSASTTCQLN
jgi:hypothetical protein